MNNIEKYTLRQKEDRILGNDIETIRNSGQERLDDILIDYKNTH